MDDDYTTPTRGGAPLLQAALALLVASTLVAFSVLAFRMGFAEDAGRDVTATDAGGVGAAVVLPSFQRSDRSPGDEPAEDGRARIAITTASDEVVVLGTRVDASTASSGRDAHRHENRRGAGHDKGRGRGHHKDHDKDKDKSKSKGEDGRGVSAREEEDDDADDHGDDASDDSDRSGSRSDGSRSGPRHRKHRDGSRGHSRGHSRGSNSN